MIEQNYRAREMRIKDELWNLYSEVNERNDKLVTKMAQGKFPFVIDVTDSEYDFQPVIFNDDNIIYQPNPKRIVVTVDILNELEYHIDVEGGGMFKVCSDHFQDDVVMEINDVLEHKYFEFLTK